MAKKEKVHDGDYVVVELTEEDHEALSAKRPKQTPAELVADKINRGEYSRLTAEGQTHEAFGKSFHQTIGAMRESIGGQN